LFVCAWTSHYLRRSLVLQCACFIQCSHTLVGKCCTESSFSSTVLGGVLKTL